MELPVRRTEWTTRVLLAAYADAWINLFGSVPSRACLALLWAQATLECGHGGRSCWNHNVGNVMAFSSWGGDFHTLRGAPECFPVGKVPAGWREQPSNIACGPGKVSAVPEKGSRFRAYASFRDGCADKLRVIDRQWPRAIVALASTADAAAFVEGLKGYFTASPTAYTATLRSLVTQCMKATPEADWPDARDTDPHPLADTDPLPPPPDTDPQTPTSRSSQNMRAVDAPIIDWSPQFDARPFVESLADDDDDTPKGAA